MRDLLVPIDPAGRVVLPKGVREELAIKPGDLFKVSIHGTAVTLTPAKAKSGLMRKGKALIFSSIGAEALSHETVDTVLEDLRDAPVRRAQESAQAGKHKK